MKLSQSIKSRFNKILERESLFNIEKILNKKFKSVEVYLVGGSVRDILLNRDIKDIDVLIRGIKIKDLEKELKRYGKVDLVGKRFSVIKFTPKEGFNQLDIAIPRRDFAFGTGGYKDFKIKSDPNLPVEEDLSRRDFTVNALAYNIKTEELIDNFGGLKDLKNKIIKTVGRPDDRFKEDYSRMLRAIRFAMQLGFEIDKFTLTSIKKNISKVNSKVGGERKVSYEIISSEFLKGFDVEPKKTIELYDKTGILKVLMPELLKLKECKQPKEYHAEGNVWKHTLLALDMLDSKEFKKYFKYLPTLTTKVALLLHDIGKPKTRGKIDGKIKFRNHDKLGADISKKILERLKASADPLVGVNIGEILWLVKNHLVFCYSDPCQMKKTTIEKYLFSEKYSGEALLQLFLADVLATWPNGGKSDLSRFKSAIKVKKELASKRSLTPPKAILTGNEVMKILNIKTGPKVGEILEDLREEQLKGKINTKIEAKRYLKSK